MKKWIGKRTEIVVGLIIGLVCLCVGVFLINNKEPEPVDPNTPPNEEGVVLINGKEVLFEDIDETQHITTEDDSILESESVLKSVECPFTDETVELLKQAEYVYIQKVISETRGYNAVFPEQKEYLISEFEIGNENPVVIDSLSNTELSFKDAFGFDYSGENAYDLYEMFKSIHFIDGDLTDVQFDIRNGNYVMSCSQSVFDAILTEKYDEILEQSVSYGIDKIGDIYVPNNFLITVTYQIDKEIVTKTLYLQIGVYVSTK